MGTATLSVLLIFPDGTPACLGHAVNLPPSTSLDATGVNEAMASGNILIITIKITIA